VRKRRGWPGQARPWGLFYLVGATIAFGSAAFAPAFANGIDSRTLTCAALQSLIQAQGFVFISQATFGDFVVADASYCAAGAITQQRTVATSDRPECPVNYCVGRAGNGGF
jgi:hypothetical protein